MYPDKALILEKLTAKPFRRRIVCTTETDSTNTLAKKLACEGAISGTVVIAARQTNGRGRNGRTWYSDDEGSLCMSFFTRPETDLRIMPAYSMCLANAVVAAMRAFGADCKIKWPNDIIAGGKKLCGILSEGSISGYHALLICGIGVNVNTHFAKSSMDYTSVSPDADFSYEQAATSLFDLTGKRHVREYVAAQILNETAKAFSELASGGLSRQAEVYAQNSCVLGHEVNVYAPDGVYSGKACGFDSLGRIVVRTEQGERIFDSGDVSLRLIDFRS